MTAGPPATTSIDELLCYDEEPPRDRRGEQTWVWAAKTAGYAAAISGLVVLGGRLVGVGLPYPVVFSVTVALLVLRRILREVTPQPFVAAAAPPPRDDWRLARSTPDGALAAAAGWDTRLSWTHSDPQRFARAVQPVLAELADERLRQRHGLTRASDPDRARELLGESPWTFLAAPVTRSVTPRQLAALVAALEAL